MINCCKNCKWRRDNKCMYCTLNKSISLGDWCIGFTAKEDTCPSGMVQIEYIDGNSETLETIENEKFHAHYIYNKDVEMFIVFTTTDERNCTMLPREFVKSIKYIEVE